MCLLLQKYFCAPLDCYIMTFLILGVVYLFVNSYVSMTTEVFLCLSWLLHNDYSYIRGCLLVRQSFFHNDPKNFADVGGGVLGCRGFHSSFRTTQSGLSLNIGKYLSFMFHTYLKWNEVHILCFLDHRRVYHYDNPTWACGRLSDSEPKCKRSLFTWLGKGVLLYIWLFIFLYNHVLSNVFSTLDQAKRVLKNLRVKTAPANQEFKITGLSEKSCREQTYVGNDLVICCYLQRKCTWAGCSTLIIYNVMVLTFLGLF